MNTPETQPPASLGAAPYSALTVEELGKLSTDIDAYMDWAQVWHKQAGGYTASDTFLTMMRMEKWARRLAELTGKPETALRKISDAEDANPSRPNKALMSNSNYSGTATARADSPPATGYGPEYLQSDMASLASVADDIAFARHHLQEREWDEVEENIRRCEEALEEIRDRMFSIRHGLMPCSLGHTADVSDRRDNPKR